MAKRWSLGCMIPAFWLPMAAGCKFTQPRDRLLADPCRLLRSKGMSRGRCQRKRKKYPRYSDAAALPYAKERLPL